MRARSRTALFLLGSVFVTSRLAMAQPSGLTFLKDEKLGGWLVYSYIDRLDDNRAVAAFLELNPDERVFAICNEHDPDRYSFGITTPRYKEDVSPERFVALRVDKQPPIRQLWNSNSDQVYASRVIQAKSDMRSMLEGKSLLLRLYNKDGSLVDLTTPLLGVDEAFSRLQDVCGSF